MDKDFGSHATDIWIRLRMKIPQTLWSLPHCSVPTAVPSQGCVSPHKSSIPHLCPCPHLLHLLIPVQNQPSSLHLLFYTLCSGFSHCGYLPAEDFVLCQDPKPWTWATSMVSLMLSSRSSLLLLWLSRESTFGIFFCKGSLQTLSAYQNSSVLYTRFLWLFIRPCVDL